MMRKNRRKGRNKNVQTGKQPVEESQLVPAGQVHTTPRKFRRRNRLQEDSYQVTNITNLNILFDMTVTSPPPHESLKVISEFTTPKSKISKVLLCLDDGDDLNNKKQQNDIVNNITNKMKFSSKEFNVNPYCKQNNSRCVSVVEEVEDTSSTSFFSPPQFQMKYSSTPIERLQKHFRKASASPTCKFNELFSVSQGKLDKNSMGKSTEELISERGAYRLSPKSNRGKTGGRPSGNWFRNYKKISMKFTARVLEMCTLLGIVLKDSFSTMCGGYNPQQVSLEATPPPSTTTHYCKCEEYNEKLSMLTAKITELSCELLLVKQQVLELEATKENVGRLSDELQSLREELSEFRSTAMEAKLKVVGVPPPPPPPPPPPLPPPVVATPVRRRLLRKTPGSTQTPSESRPVISLDDILKVKLKKPVIRSVSTPVRRNSQPVVSADMLSQVKLKPTRRNNLPMRPQLPMSPNLTTSPISSLNRLLNEKSSVCRVKRLRKVNSFNFSSNYSRNVGKRELHGS